MNAFGSNYSDNCVHHYNVEILNLFDPELQLINQWLKKLKELLSKLEKFKVQAILVLDYKKRNDHKIFHSGAKLIASDSDSDETCKSMHQSIMRKRKIMLLKIVLDIIIKHNINIFE